MGALKPHQYKIIGMQKDNSISAFDPKYSYDNKNIRITSLDDNTQLSVVNEKGTSLLSVINTSNGDSFTIIGKPIGYNVIDEELILFTTQSTEEDITTSTNNNIYKLNRLTASIIGGYLGIDYEIVNVINPLLEENLFTIEIVINEFIRDNTGDIKISSSKIELFGNGISGIIPYFIDENTELITINRVTIKYDDRILYTNYVHEYFQKPERILSFNTLKEIIPSLNVLHINFPYYSNPSETINNSEAVLITSPKKLKVINGKDISNNDEYITIPNSVYTTNHYLFVYNSDDTFELISTLDTPIDNYNLVYYYAPKVFSRVFFDNRISDIEITDFPANVIIEQEYTFYIKLNYEANNPNLVSKDLNIFFDKKYILITYKNFNTSTDTYEIKFKANMNVSSGESFIYIQSAKYPNINKSLSFNIRNYRVPITIYEDSRVVTDVVLNIGKFLTENTFTVDTNRPYTITTDDTTGNWITYTAINTNTYEITGDDDGYKLGSISIQYDDETEGTEIIVEQVPNANITSEELVVDCNYSTIPPFATLNDIVICRVYAAPAKTYSGPIKVTYPTGFELLNIIKKIESINDDYYLVHYYTFQVVNVINNTVAINFSINNIDVPSINAALYLERPPKIPEEIITTTPQDFVIKLGEEVTIDAFVNPTGTNNIGEDTGLYLENTNLYTDLSTVHTPDKTTFKFKLNTVPEQQVITISSYDNPNIFKHIPYQVEYINN